MGEEQEAGRHWSHQEKAASPCPAADPGSRQGSWLSRTHEASGGSQGPWIPTWPQACTRGLGSEEPLDAGQASLSRC